MPEAYSANPSSNCLSLPAGYQKDLKIPQRIKRKLLNHLAFPGTDRLHNHLIPRIIPRTAYAHKTATQVFAVMVFAFGIRVPDAQPRACFVENTAYTR